MKRTLITGGAGFIGLNVVEELKAKDYEVFVFDNLSFGRRDLVPVDDAHFIEGDIRDREAVDAALSAVQPDAVVHLAAIHFIPYCNQHPFEATQVNLAGTIHVLDALRAYGKCAKLLFASTAAVYPIQDEPAREDGATEPLDIYGMTKWVDESLMRGFALETGVPTTVVRFFNAFGPKETNPHLIPEIQQQVLKGERTVRLGNLEPKRDFIHTRDMARAMRLLIERGGEGCETFNLGSGGEVSVREVVEAFSKGLGEGIEIDQDPAKVRKVDRLHLVSDIGKLKAAIDWQPEISFEAGIAEILKEDRSYDQW